MSEGLVVGGWNLQVGREGWAGGASGGGGVRRYDPRGNSKQFERGVWDELGG